MSISQHWATRIAGRVLTSAVIGALVSAFGGALCVGAAGALLGWIMDIRSTPPSWDSGFLVPGAELGAYLGSLSAIVGAIAGSIVAFDAQSSRSFAPLRAVLTRIAWGQLLGTLGALSCYFLFVILLVQTRAQPFVGTVEDNLEFIIWGAPLAMICGAIAGALWKPGSAREAEVN